MPVIVGVGFIVLGGLILWGAISGRLAKMAAAFFPNAGVDTTSYTPPTGIEPLAIPSGGALM